MSLGVYVHFPYCSRRCPYCDFTITVKPVEHGRYRDGVLAELAARAPRFAGRPPAVSVYFGGGTPGLWAPDCIAQVIEAVDARLGLAGEAEITIEANPGEVTAAHLVGWRAAGVNRISLGVQSFDDRWLTVLGRDHGAAGGRAAVEAIARSGLPRFSVDLIHGMAGQTVAEARDDVQIALDLGARHVSTYQLTVEPQTAFGARARRGERLLGDEARLLAMYRAIRATLRAGGLIPYEVSSAAAPGHAAVHNQLYWSDGEYLALGVGAHGYRHLPGGRAFRWHNPPQIDRWHAAAIAGAPLDLEPVEVEADERIEERLMCGLRRDIGVEVSAEMQARFGARALRLEAAGLLAITAGRWAATDRGRMLLDTLIGALLTGDDPALSEGDGAR